MESCYFNTDFHIITVENCESYYNIYLKENTIKLLKACEKDNEELYYEYFKNSVEIK